MKDTNRIDAADNPDDSNLRRHDKDSVAEETSATGQRLKGAAKNAAGIDRQRKNDGA